MSKIIASAFVVFFVALSIDCPMALAALELGVGTTSATSGRLVPSLAAGWTGNQWGMSVFSTGVQNEYYYHSAYGLHGFKTWNAGALGSGQVRAGLGLGLFYARRAFTDSGGALKEEADDFTSGPAFQVNWNFLSSFYMEIQGLYGLQSPGYLLQLSGQDIVSFSIGYSL